MEKFYASPAREKGRVDRNFHSGMAERGDIFGRAGATAKKVIDMDDFLSYGKGPSMKYFHIMGGGCPKKWTYG